MTAVRKPSLISVEDYLAGEANAACRHEFVDGRVHAMAGATNLHNRLCTTILGELDQRLRGHPCQPCTSDTKIRIRKPGGVRFYYPDVSVICRPNPPEDHFQDKPVVVVEVLSPGTRRLDEGEKDEGEKDEGEKKEGYLSLPSLAVYLLVETAGPVVVAHRRTEQGFVREVVAGLEAAIPLPEIGIELPLAALYDRVEFPPEAEDEDEEEP